MSKPSSPVFQPSNSLANGLVRCHAFVEGSGSTIADYSGQGATLTTRTNGVTAAATWKTDPVQGPYISLDGSTQDGTSTDVGLPAGNSERTFAFIFRTTGSVAANSYFVETIGSLSGSELFTYGVGSATPTNAKTLYSSTATTPAAGNVAVNDGQWHLGVITASGGTTSFYCDGAAQGSAPQALGTVLNGTAYFGQLGNGSNYFVGDIAGKSTWSRVLSSAEITSLNSDPWQMVRPATTATPTPSPTTTPNPTPTTTSNPTPTTTPNPTPTTTQVPVTDTNRYFSPSSFYSDGAGSKQTNGIMAGSIYAETTSYAYEKTGVTGTTSVGLTVDVSKMAGGSIPSYEYPIIAWSIDSGPTQRHQLTSADTVVSLVSGLTSSAHTVEWWVQFMPSVSDTYTPICSVKVGALVLSSGGSTVAPVLAPNIVHLYGDSITAGAAADGVITGASDEDGGYNSRHSFAYSVARALDGEFCQWARPGGGYENTSAGGWPGFGSSFSQYSSGKSALIGGKFSPAPTHVVLEIGQNGNATAAEVAGMLASVRAASAASTWVFYLVPFSGSNRSSIQAGFASYGGMITSHTVGTMSYATCANDPYALLLDLGNQAGLISTTGTSEYSLGGVHPDRDAAGWIAAKLSILIGCATTAAGVATSTSPTDGTLGDVLAKLATINSAIADLPNAIQVSTQTNPLCADVREILGSTPAAHQLLEDCTNPISSDTLGQVSDAVWANSKRTVTAFPFAVTLAGNGLDAVQVENGVSLPKAVGAIHSQAVGVITGDGAQTGTGNFTVTVGSTVRMTGVMLKDTRTAVSVTYFGTTTAVTTTANATGS